MFKLGIGWLALSAVAIGGGGYYAWKKYGAGATATTPEKGGATTTTTPTTTSTTSTTTTTTLPTPTVPPVDLAAARIDWNRGVVDGAEYAYNATVKSMLFDTNPSLFPPPAGVTNPAAYAAGHVCGRAQGLRLGTNTISLLLGATAAAALTFDRADVAGGGIAKSQCSVGLDAWLASPAGGSVIVSGVAWSEGRGGPVVFGRKLWGGAPIVRQMVATGAIGRSTAERGPSAMATDLPGWPAERMDYNNGYKLGQRDMARSKASREGYVLTPVFVDTAGRDYARGYVQGVRDAGGTIVCGNTTDAYRRVGGPLTKFGVVSVGGCKVGAFLWPSVGTEIVIGGPKVPTTPTGRTSPGRYF